VVRLGDIVENAGEFSSHALFRAPPPGGKGIIRAERILVVIQALGIEGFDPRGLSHVMVKRPVREATHDEVAASVKAALVRVEPTLAKASFRLDPLAKPLTVESLGEASLNVEVTRFDAGLERFEARVATPLAPEPLRVSGAIQARAQVVVLTRNIPRGEPVRAADLRVETRKNHGVTTGYISDAAIADGLVARRALSAGQPIRPEDLVRPEIIEKNQMVTIIFEADGIMLALRGKALAGGIEGATIPVQNLQSKRTLEAIVAGPGRVRLPNPK
jgi:flagella basal body P-ring formation protein FlgA